jgi:hypothetical protein
MLLSFVHGFSTERKKGEETIKPTTGTSGQPRFHGIPCAENEKQAA